MLCLFLLCSKVNQPYIYINLLFSGFPYLLVTTVYSVDFPVLYSKEVKSLSRVQLFATPWTVALQAPRSMRFSRQENWSGLPFPSPGDLPNPGIKPGSLALQADALSSEPPGKPGIQCYIYSAIQ